MIPNPIKVLVVHSQPDILKTITAALQKRSYYVSSANNGLEGMFIGNEMKYDMILSAIDLPKITGFEMIRTLQGRFRNRSTPVFFIGTGEESPEVVQHAGILHAQIMSLSDILNGIGSEGDTESVFKKMVR
jgi:PleD family two-component response regulator